MTRENQTKPFIPGTYIAALNPLMRGLIILALMFFSLSAFARPEVSVPDIRKIPQLSENLPAGTIAWALVDQLHPTQPQTGHREVRKKAKAYRDLFEKNDGEFPQKLYEEMFQKFIVPIYSGPIKRTDSRYKTEEMLGYNTDRTHTSFAMASAIEKVYGREALSKPLFDKEGRPLNFVLVKVVENKTNMTFDEFSEFMVDERHTYLKFWSKDKDGGTSSRKIAFSQIPEKVYETIDFPFRSLVSWLQRQGYLGRAKTDYSQFVDAETLAKYSGIEWKDIDDLATHKDLDRARERAIKFIKSGSHEALSMPGEKILINKAQNCNNALGG